MFKYTTPADYGLFTELIYSSSLRSLSIFLSRAYFQKKFPRYFDQLHENSRSGIVEEEKKM